MGCERDGKRRVGSETKVGSHFGAGLEMELGKNCSWMEAFHDQFKETESTAVCISHLSLLILVLVPDV